MTDRIGELLVKRAKPPAVGNRITYDDTLRGFGLRITSAGTKAFILNYRFNGRERRITIGGYPEWSAAAARRRAEELKRQIDLGVDPLSQREDDRAAATVSELCALYVDRHLPKKRPNSQRDDLAAINTFLVPRLGRMKVTSVRYVDIDALHRDISRTAPFRANRVVALLSRLFSLAIKWGITADNPAKGIERNPEQPRARYLDRSELVRLVEALSVHPDQTIADAVRLLLLTGARKSEVLNATWDQFDLETGVWVKPAATVKQARLHRIPLSSLAVSLLRDRRETIDGPLLFPSRQEDKPLVDIKRSWEKIRTSAGLNDVRLHDLRHTFASHIVSSGGSLPLIGSLLGHTQHQTTLRYAHLYDDPMRAATEQFASLLVMDEPGPIPQSDEGTLADRAQAPSTDEPSQPGLSKEALQTN